MGNMTKVWFIFIVIVLFFTLVYFAPFIIGNKTLIDINQNFKYAYIDIDGKSMKIEITTWKDWEDSDSIQIVDTNGKVYYTHLNRVVLMNK